MKTLNVQTSRPYLDITTTRAQLNISNKFRRFTAKRSAPEMKVDRKAPSFKVDWNRVWAESGRRSPGHLKNYLNQRSKQKVNQAITNIVQNGNYMLRLENYIGTKSSPVAQLANQNMKADSLVEVNVASMPESRPDVQWDPGYVRIEWTTGELQVEWDNDFGPDITVTPHSVEIRVAGKNEVKISVDEKKIATPRGKKVNKRI